MSDPAFLTIAEASKLIAARKLSPVELAEACLGRIASLDHLLDSFVTLTARRARSEAKAAEAAVMTGKPLGRLHGIPYCLKDIYDTAGIRTTAMSKLLADNVPARDAWCQEKMAAAGGVLLDKNATWNSPMAARHGTFCFRRRATRGTGTIRRPVRPQARRQPSLRAFRPRRSAATPAVRSAARPRPAVSPA